MVNKALIIFSIFFLLPLAAVRGEEGVFVVIANAPGAVTIDELRNIYFNNGGRLGNGQVVVPIDYKEDNPLYERFYQQAFGRSKSQMKAYWAQRIFTGKGNPPRSVAGSKEALELVAGGKSPYIAYMRESDITPKVSVLLRVH